MDQPIIRLRYLDALGGEKWSSVFALPVGEEVSEVLGVGFHGFITPAVETDIVIPPPDEE